MVVVHPDEIAWPVDLRNFLGKGGVGGFVEGVMGVGGGVFRGDILPQKVVEKGPQN